jgi:uncharacterized protein YcaQ
LRARWRDGRRAGFERQFQVILDQIRSEGPVTSGDVGKDEKRGSGGWWDWHPSKTALEYLWRSGAVCVVGRDGFRKRYDLTERVLEQQYCTDSNMPDPVETIHWCCDQALARLGFATHGEIAAFWAHVTPAEAKTWCQTERAAGRLQEIAITGADGSIRTAFARPGLDQDPALELAPCPRLRVLSPFDPALRDRKRAERLFGFDYRIEVFVPAPQRRFGYYVFPILEGDRLVGRVDMKAFRDEDHLRVHALWPEGTIAWGKGRQTAFARELERISRLAGVSRVVFDDGWLRGSAQGHLG